MGKNSKVDFTGQDIYVGIDTGKKNWNWLESLSFERDSGKQSLQTLLEELKHLRQSIAHLTKQIRNLARQEPYRTQVELLDSIPGIGTLYHFSLDF